MTHLAAVLNKNFYPFVMVFAHTPAGDKFALATVLVWGSVCAYKHSLGVFPNCSVRQGSCLIFSFGAHIHLAACVVPGIVNSRAAGPNN